MALRLLMMVPSVKLNAEPGELGVGGAERMALQLCRNFDPSRIDAQLLIFRDPGRSAANIQASQVKWHLIPKRGRLDLRFWLGMRALIKREKIDAVLSLLQGTNLHNLLVTPTVRGVACLISYRAPQMIPRLARIEGGLAGRADALIVPAPWLIDIVGEYYRLPRERIVAIPNGCDESVFQYVPYDRRLALRAELGLPEDALILFNSNRIERVKGHDVCARALAGIPELLRRHKVLWVCTGSSQDREYFQQVQALCEPIREHVRLLPHTHEPQRWMAAADAMCVSSRFESFGLAVLEGAFVGRPFVATKVGVVSELEGLDCGFAVQPDSAESLREGIVQLLGLSALQRAEMGARLYRLAKSRYSIRASADQYAAAVEAAVRRHRGRRV
jgi:glycosyltransferase involved in cell wall biosynthesis